MATAGADPEEGGVQTSRPAPPASERGFCFCAPLTCNTLRGLQTRVAQKQKRPAEAGRLLVCGEGGIRTPGGLTLNGFQDRRNRPLCHLSLNRAAKLRILFQSAQDLFIDINVG